MNPGKVRLGILTGITAGDTSETLFITRKGSSTWEKIYRKGGMYAIALKEKFNEFFDSILNKFDSTREEDIRIAENWKAKTEEVEVKAISRHE